MGDLLQQGASAPDRLYYQGRAGTAESDRMQRQVAKTGFQQEGYEALMARLPLATRESIPEDQRAIGRTGHRSGITAALHSHRTPATGALMFLFPVASLRKMSKCY